MLTHIEKTEADLRKAFNDKMTEEQENKKEEDQLEQMGGGKEAELENDVVYLHSICDHYILNKGLFAKFAEILKSICEECKKKYLKPQEKEAMEKFMETDEYLVEKVSILSLCKFMYISKKYANDNLSTIFALIKSHIDPSIKSNIIISIGDLCNRFPNNLEPWKNHIFQSLTDHSPLVRKTTLMVISHLILNDMIKVL